MAIVGDMFNPPPSHPLTPSDFTFWLWSSFELANPTTDPRKVGFTPEQATVIADHLRLVFTKVTPDRAAKPAPTYCANVPGPSSESNLLCRSQFGAICDANPLDLNVP